MAEYIEREAVLDYIRYKVCQGEGNIEHRCQCGSCGYCGICEIMSDISSMPAADVQPVKRGHWEKDEKGQFHHCSECGDETFRDVDSWGLDYGEFLSNFCPHCGADMREADATKG